MSAHSDYLDPDGFCTGNQEVKYEIYEERTWEIYDPWNAVTIAVFNDKARADEYVAFLNGEAAQDD